MRRNSLLTSLVILLVLMTPALAVKGVGIKFGLEYTTLSAGQETCLDYKVYNPWDEDVKIELAAGGELEPFFESSEKKDVAAHTSSGEAIPLEICFSLPAMSEEECEGVTYVGEVLAREAVTSTVGGTGSAAVVVASAPLTIEPICGELVSGAPVAVKMGEIKVGQAFYWILAVVSLAALVVVATAYYRNPGRKRRKYMKMYHEVIQLQKDLMVDPFHQAKRFRYNELCGKMQNLRREL